MSYFYLGNIHNSFTENEAHGEKILERMLPAAQQKSAHPLLLCKCSDEDGENEDALEVLNQPISVEGVFLLIFFPAKEGLARLKIRLFRWADFPDLYFPI